MDSKKKTSAKEATASASTQDEKRGPLKSFHESDVWCNVYQFDNETKNGTRTNYSVTLSRSYKDSAGKWKSTRFFGREDLSTVMGLAESAAQYIDGLKYPASEPMPDQAD